MRGVAETVNAEPTGIAGFPIGTIAEHAGAKQRRNIDIVVILRQTKTVARVSHSELRVAAVDVVAGEFSIIAEVFAIRSTISTIAIGPAEPGNADTVANFELLT